MSEVGPIQMWRASDGTYHESEQAFQAHEASIKDEVNVARFIEQADLKRGQATRVKNIVLDYLAWQEGQSAA